MELITIQIYDEKKCVRKGYIRKAVVDEWRDFTELRSAFCIVPDNIIFLRRPRYTHNETIEREVENDIEHETLHIVLYGLHEDEASWKLDDFDVESFMKGYIKRRENKDV